MKLDIPYYIRQVLREQRMVHVPGIGTFRIQQTSAYFNDDKTLISPPSLNLSFDDAESEDDSLLKYILDTGLLSEAKAKKKIAEFTQSAFNKLLNVDSFLIDGVGTIVKKADSTSVEFEPNLTDLTKEYSDLKSLSLTPISRISEQKPLAATPLVDSKVDDSGSFLPRIILLSFLLIALWFVGQYFYNSYNSEPTIDDTEILNEESLGNEIIANGNTEEDSSFTSESNEKELQQKYEEIDELIDPLKENDQVKSGNDPKLNEELANLTENIDNQEVGEVDNGDEDIDQSNEPETIIEEPVKEVGTKSTELSEDENIPVNKHADIIPASGECIIVVGSFMKSLNTIKMVSLLERKGYTVYQSEYKGFTRVGLKYECENEDLEAYLHSVRKKISKKAWYLDPDLVVPYLR